MTKVFVTDLDGTLLNQKGALSDGSRELLNQLIERGVPFTVASARSIDSIRAVIKDLPLKLPVIEFNGSYITDYHTGEKLVVNAIDRSMNHKISAIIESYDLSMIVTVHENNNDHLYYDYSSLSEGGTNYIDFRRNNGDQRLYDGLDRMNFDTSDIICFNVIDLEDKIRAVHDRLIEEFGVELEVHMMKGTYTSKWAWLNVADPEGTKGHALKVFKELYLNSEDQLVVFGDNNNDIEMFEIADLPIALENSVQVLKNMAVETIGSNDEDSVAKYIYKKVGESLEADR
jgi:Cof subfamily protein (haloacid dehalogenase superfamily)